ncbi:MAG: hypothetical protein RLN86_00795 [Cyclobacteriaceae bacterium]
MRSLVHIMLASILYYSCTSSNNSSNRRLEYVKQYLRTAVSQSDLKWQFTTDTIRVWFDDRNGKPNLNYKNKELSKWAEWDVVMNSTTSYDSLWYDQESQTVQGHFYEYNDFYKLIGRPPNKTLRTYWFDDQDKIKEILIYWIPEDNKTSDEFLPPIIEWAEKYYPVEINELYTNQEIKPSTQNAIRWKTLLEKFHHFHDSIKGR